MAKIPKKVKAQTPKELEEAPKKHKRKKSQQIKAHKTADAFKSSEAKKTKVNAGRIKNVIRSKTNKRRKAPTATKKLRTNVLATIKRAEKRGYKFSDELKEKLKSAKYQTLLSYQRNKYRKLYGEATVQTIEGEITGTQYRQYERQRASQKAAETRRLKKQLEPAGSDEVLKEVREERKEARKESTEEYYHEPEVIENEDGFAEEEARRQAEFERKKNDEIFKQSVQVGDMMINTVYDVITKYENLGAGQFGTYFKELMKYYEARYSIESIKAALASIDMEDFLEKVDDVLYYGGNNENVIKSVQALQTFIDKALLYSGLTPDFSWDQSIEEMAEHDLSNFSDLRG